MATITIKNIPDELYELIKEQARTNRRSINSEVIVRLHQQFTPKRDVEAILAEARALRELTSHFVITEEEINQAKNEGRP